MASLKSQLQNVENLLNLLVHDLTRLEKRELAHSSASTPEAERWKNELEGFRVKASTIRRIMDHFHSADLPTRRYLRQHLDEEFASLKRAYDSLRHQFTTPHEEKEGSSWSG